MALAPVPDPVQSSTFPTLLVLLIGQPCKIMCQKMIYSIPLKPAPPRSQRNVPDSELRGKPFQQNPPCSRVDQLISIGAIFTYNGDLQGHIRTVMSVYESAPNPAQPISYDDASHKCCSHVTLCMETWSWLFLAPQCILNNENDSSTIHISTSSHRCFGGPPSSPG